MRSTRDLALVGVLALTGLRISEALNIQVGDLTEERGHHVVTVTRKGGERQVMVIAPPVVPVIRDLEAERGSGYLFLNGKGTPMSRQQASALVSAMARKAGVKGNVTAHSLRHTYVTLALDAGVSLRDVAAGAGHRDVRTTMRYDRARHSLERSPTYAVTSHVTWDVALMG
jgi:integrase